MKRLLLPLALVACAAACAPAPSDNANANASNTNAANMNAANSNTSSSATTSDADLMAKDREIYDALKKRDNTAFGALLADDFLYVTGDGIHSKADTLKVAAAMEFTEIALTDFKVVRIDKDAAVVTYTTDTKSTTDGKSKSEKDHESSVWVNRGGKWLMIYHQDCVVQTMPMPANASANSNMSANSNKATTAASPASAATTTADAEANEKMVWEAIKRRDANGFANFLADDALEVEPDKVYSKSESVSSISAQDFLASVTLGDFQTKKIDDDASIVIYSTKGTGPDKKPFNERHATVWANRGGKWLAVFHHGGTQITPAPPVK